MKFTAEEARAIIIESISKNVGIDKMISIIDAIRKQAQEGFTYLNICCNKFDIDNKFSYLIGIWAEFNGYKVTYPRDGVVTIDWKNV